ncbi:hypothetical protein [Colwellia psychrerythraea]|uniref:Carbohydrate-binding domain-containing protein n=1 Tax=Colwellia psychrerythraea TaxID=28229 RepID=A0A099KQH0_COLPS|nr:hypothetical protein [Colwellia psychrerythraea]KGJ91923.1 hypothetical protein GAB14E_3080 [Colwellia psychrerythraea]
MLHKLSKTFISGIVLSAIAISTIALSLVATQANASEVITINATNKAPLFDGRCDKDEWQSAIKFELPAQSAVYLMHDNHSLYVCAKGKAEDYAVIDIYVEHANTGYLHRLHASAQLGERIFNGKEWSKPDRWNLKHWSGFWVPYAGRVEAEDGLKPKFLKGSHREMQILRKKFPGDTWKMMIGVSGINQNEGSTAFYYPEKAVETDSATWAKFAFSKLSSTKLSFDK